MQGQECEYYSSKVFLQFHTLSALSFSSIYNYHVCKNYCVYYISINILKQAIISTATRRESLPLMKQVIEIIEDIKDDDYLKELWKVYLADNLYVGDLNFLLTIKIVELIAEEITL